MLSNLNFNPMLFMIALVGWSVGLTLLVIGWYGRRIDDHPICRRCRFDLFGLELGNVKKCPECGTNVCGPGTVLTGQRVKRRVVVSAALLVLLGAAGLTATNLVPIVSKLDWMRIRPAGWLLSDVASKNAATETAAVGELARRIKGGKLGADALDQIIEIAFMKQADRGSAWQVPYGEVLDEALMGGRLDDAQKERFLRQMLEPVILVVDEGVVSRDSGAGGGDVHRMSFVLETGIMRLAYNLDLGLLVRSVGYAVDGGDFILMDGRNSLNMAFSPFSGTESTMPMGIVQMEFEPGVHEIRSVWVFELTDRATQEEVKQTGTVWLTSAEWEFVSSVKIED